MQLNNKYLQHKRGFSLVELMVVVAIIGIAGVYAVPTFSGWIADTKTRTVAESLQNGLRLAQSEAVSRGVQVQFVLTDAAPTAKDLTASATGRNWMIQSLRLDDPTETDLYIEGGNLGDVNGTSLINSSSAILTFNSVGRMTVPARQVTINLSNPKGKRDLRMLVSKSGKIKVCDPAKTLSASNPDGCP